jgi:hypothetical protein
MVEHPDYLEFLFLSGQKDPVVIVDGQFQHHQSPDCPFYIFRQCALNYLDSLNAKIEDRTADILMIWVLVHGLAVLLAKQSVKYSGDYLDLVAKMVNEKLRFES